MVGEASNKPRPGREGLLRLHVRPSGTVPQRRQASPEPLALARRAFSICKVAAGATPGDADERRLYSVNVRILYVAMADDYGIAERGPSFEETNFRSSLTGMGHELECFDFIARSNAIGVENMNEELVETATRSRPDLVFFVLFENEIPPACVEATGSAADAPTMNWFADDHWRFETFSRHYAHALDWVITTDHAAVSKYRDLGQANTLLSQWACNKYAYGRRGRELRHETTFVGQPHGNRREIIDDLIGDGIPVECWGTNWPNGRLDHEGLVRVFSTSRINLNLSNSSTPPSTVRARIGALVKRVDRSPRPSQIKGRTFEVPGCAGFLLTDRVPHLEEYFVPDREVAVYDGDGDLADRIKFWLKHDVARSSVAEAGYSRVMAEHTYNHRFRAIFEAAGLQ